jgi:hypothetical protein
MREATLLSHDRWRVEPAQPDWTARLLLVGLVVGLIIATGVIRGGPGMIGRVLAGTWALACTVGGVLLLFLWLFTNHVMSAWNLNLLLFSPLALALLALLVGRGRQPVARMLALGFAATVLLGALLGFGGVLQDNRELAALMVLPSFAAVWVALEVSRRRGAAPTSLT